MSIGLLLILRTLLLHNKQKKDILCFSIPNKNPVGTNFVQKYRLFPITLLRIDLFLQA